jgi:hypothetical protein
MRLLIYILPFIKSDNLNVNILYEKLVDPEMEQLYKDIVVSIIDRYNTLMINLNIQIKVDDVSSYGVYSEDSDYKGLQKYSGSEDLKGRMSVISNINKNILLIASVQNDIKEDIVYEMDVPCRSKYVTSFSYIRDVDVDTISGINNSIKRWLNKLLDTKIPNPFGINNLERVNEFVEGIRKSNFVEKLRTCTRKNNILVNERNGVEFGDQLENLVSGIPSMGDISSIEKSTKSLKNDKNLTDEVAKEIYLKIKKELEDENKNVVKHKGKVVNLVNSFKHNLKSNKKHKLRK